MNPLLSVITASYNSDKTIEKTIESLLNQNYSNFEYIIIDGGSNDKTLDIIKKYESIFKEKKINYTWLSEKDSGIYNAWNKGLKFSKGKWISFLGSDDVYLDSALKKYAEKISQNEDADFIHSKVKLINDDKIKFIVSDRWVWKNFKREMKIAHVGSFHNKKYFKKYGKYDEKYKIVGDYELLLRAQNQLKTFFFDDFTAEMKDGGVSNQNILAAFREVRKAKIQTAKISKPLAYFDFYFFIVKYYLSKVIKKQLM